MTHEMKHTPAYGAESTVINIPGAVSTEAEGINDFGQIVGVYYLGGSGTSGTPHAYFKQDASSLSFSTIDPPGASWAGTGGINNLGQIAGVFSDGNGVHGFLKDGATFSFFDVPSGSFTGAHAINDKGQIVGEYRSTVNSPSRGFLKDGASYTTIDVPGAVVTEAYGINSQGHISGLFRDASDRFHGFLATTGDSDGDGVPDNADVCPGTPAGEVVDASGCSINQLCPCNNQWENHGQYVSCVAQTSNDFVTAGLITEAERDAIVSKAAQSSCGENR
jgi:uncharacterized membrane protein